MYVYRRRPRAHRYVLLNKKIISRSFESFFEKELTFTRESEPQISSVGGPRPSRCRLVALILDLNLEIASKSSAPVNPENAFITSKREYPVELTDFSLLDSAKMQNIFTSDISNTTGREMGTLSLTTAFRLIDRFEGKSPDELSEFLKSHESTAISRDEQSIFPKTVIEAKIKGRPAKK